MLYIRPYSSKFNNQVEPLFVMYTATLNSSAFFINGRASVSIICTNDVLYENKAKSKAKPGTLQVFLFQRSQLDIEHSEYESVDQKEVLVLLV